MTTTVTKTIGTGGDYTTLQAWEDASPANLVTSDQVWQGQCFNQEFVTSSATLLTVSGTTTDATRYKELMTYAGASFVDNASVQTNELRYNASNGAGIRSTYAWLAPVAVNESYFRISKLQILAGTATAFQGTGTTGLVMDKCIIENSGVSNEALRTYGACTVKNTLVVGRSTGVVALLSNGTEAYNCTFARTASSTSNIFTGAYGTSTLKNCAFFGGATTLASGSSTRTYTTCYTDTASPPSGCTTVAYDTSTGSGFENKTDATRDFRIKTGSALINVGTTDSTNAANDIAGTARPQGSAYDVGAWELASAGGAGNASGSFDAISITPPTATGSGKAAASGSLTPISITGPTATASGGAAGNASGSMDSVTLSSPTATASGSASASGSLATITLNPSTATASGAASANGSLDAITLVAPSASAAGGSIGNASGSLASITIDAATGAATGAAAATATPAQISITAPAAIASAGEVGNAFGNFMALVLTPVEGVATGGALATGLFAGISLIAPTATASGSASAVYPLPAQVLLGVTYGPTGADYTGTATGSGLTANDIAAAVWAYTP